MGALDRPCPTREVEEVLTLTCNICDEPITAGEARERSEGHTVHRYCSTEGGSVCLTPGCMWQYTEHAGECD